MDTEASLREYLKLHLRIPVVGRIGPLAKAFDFVATAAPGVREILTVGKFCWEVKERHYDLVVVDAPASGHIIGQLAAPQAINDLVKVGLIRSQTDWMLEILSDPRQTGPRRRLHARGDAGQRDARAGDAGARGDDGAHVGRGGQPRPARAVRPARRGDLRAAARARDRARCCPSGPAASVTPVLEAARLAVTLRRTRSTHLQRLQAGPPRGHARCSCCPTCSPRSFGVRTTRQVAHALGEELGL